MTKEYSMKIIISPAKKMNCDTDSFAVASVPIFKKEAQRLYTCLQEMSYEELKSLWNCNDKIATVNYERLHKQNLSKNLTPAILAYEGIQYQYMSPLIFSEQACQYAKSHLRILSGLYGVLRPFDGVVQYRLEMQANLAITGAGSTLYEYWGERLYKEVAKDEKLIVNLASAEYSKTIERYKTSGIRFLTCIFGECVEGKVKVKGTFAKMARGEMVRWMCEEQIEEVEQIKQFTGLGYAYAETYSTENEWVFIAPSAKLKKEVK